jgi:hypothetical protein
VKAHQIADCLCNKFRFEPKRKTGHVHYELRVAGLPPIRTHVSHHHGKHADVGPQLLAAIAAELHVRAGFLKEMLTCTKSREDYLQVLRSDPYPPFATLS